MSFSQKLNTKRAGVGEGSGGGGVEISITIYVENCTNICAKAFVTLYANCRT